MTATEAQVARLINDDMLLCELEFLTGSRCAGRGTGSPGANVAALWISSGLKNAGAKPVNGSYIKSFTAKNGRKGHNVVGMIPSYGIGKTDNYIIVTAHYDNIGTIDGKMYPGADSNASGVATLLSLARMFGWMSKGNRTLKSNILFVAFDAKEVNMSGSEHLWKMIEAGLLRNPGTGMRISKEKIKLVVNIDQIGSSLSPINESKKEYLTMLGVGSLPENLQKAALTVNNFNDTKLDLSFTYYGSKKFTELFYRASDQRIFVDNGIPAVLFTSGITMNTNKTRDTVENLDIEVLLKRIHYIYHWLYRTL